MKLSEIFTFDNLYNSHKKCRLSKQHKGEVVRFEIDLAKSLSKLVNEFQKGTYKSGKYKFFTIHDPKIREIEALTYKDRIVIRCFCDYSLIPRLQDKLILDNAACQKNKGTLFARERLMKFLRAEYARGGKSNDFYFLKCDISKYFPSINHRALIWQLAKYGFSKEELKFMWQFIKAGKYQNDEQGLPLGNQTSQWFALLYLDTVDRFIKEKLRIKGYVRYMDDFILIHQDKKFLQECKSQIEELCWSKLKLKLNRKTQIGKVRDGINFLGFNHKVLPNGEIEIAILQQARVRLKRHIKVLKRVKEKGIVDEEYIKQRVNSFSAHLSRSNRNKLLSQKVKEFLVNHNQT